MRHQGPLARVQSRFLGAAPKVLSGLLAESLDLACISDSSPLHNTPFSSVPRAMGSGQQQWPVTAPQASSQLGSATASLYFPSPHCLVLSTQVGHLLSLERYLLKSFTVQSWADGLASWTYAQPSALQLFVPLCSLHLKCLAAFLYNSTDVFHLGTWMARPSSSFWERSQGCSEKAL